MTRFLILRGKTPVACSYTLRNAYTSLYSMPPGLYTIRFGVNDETVDLNRYTFSMDAMFIIPKLLEKEKQ